MPFTFAADVTQGGRSDNTVRIYKTRLNKIAKAGFEDTAALLRAPSKVIAAINDMHQEEELKLKKAKRLEMLTSVMYALQNIPNDNAKKLQYYKAFQTNKHKTPDEVRKTDPAYRSAKEMQQ